MEHSSIVWRARSSPIRLASAPPPDVFRDNLTTEMKHLRAFAISLSGSVSAGDDLVQETFLRVWSKSDPIPAGTNIRVWLKTVLRNIFYSSFRRRAGEVQDREGLYPARPRVLGGQEDHIDRLEFHIALAQLPDHQREVLLLVDASGHTYEEAASICQVVIGTVTSRVNHVRRKLIELLKL
jgi:RNA polymerase sigma-70 factor (ECF subfamily)